MEKSEFNLVHIASHGVFGNDVDETFVLTYDGKLSMEAMDQWVGQFKNQSLPLELLTLSACETAAGDDRAALGLAGVAVRAGAKSALATLWAVEDQAAALLVMEFYQQLRSGAASKAVALQRAQVKLLQDPHFAHPGYWSPFLLINNWL
jgi:CHAT domain-containing protein